LQRMVARARVLPDAVVVPIAASGEISIAQALLRLLDAITPPEADDLQTGLSETAQVPSAG